MLCISVPEVHGWALHAVFRQSQPHAHHRTPQPRRQQSFQPVHVQGVQSEKKGRSTLDFIKNGFACQVGHKSHRIGFGGSKLNIIVKGYVFIASSLAD
jgi:hypothetical protein